LRDRFRDRVDDCVSALAGAWRAGDTGVRERALEELESAVRAWPDETKVNAKLLMLLAEAVQKAHDDGHVLKAWQLLRSYTGERDESLRSLVEQRGVALGELIERARDASMRAGGHDAALALNRMLLERRDEGDVDPITERAWFAQLDLFRATQRSAAGRAFAEKIGRWCREANREDLLDRIAEWEERFRAPPLLLRVSTPCGRLEIEASGTAGGDLDGRPRQRALLVLTFAYPSGLAVEDAGHMIDLMWRRSSPKWPGPGGKLALLPLPTTMDELSNRMVVVRERKVREAMEKLVADTIASCSAAVNEPLLRLVESRIERDDPQGLLRVEIADGAAWRSAQPSDAAAALRSVGIIPLVDFAKVQQDEAAPPARPGRPRTINSSLKRKRLQVDEEDAPPDGLNGFYPDSDD
jgi:hypothetical protein